MTMKVLRRDEILGCIVDALQPLDFVYAMWQCGSAAFGRVDEWSDIDVVVDVEDNRVNDIFTITDKVLGALSPIESSFGAPQALSPGGYQKVYKLKDTSEFLVIEICAVKHSSTEKFLQREVHGEVFVHFDKKNVTDHKPIDKVKFAEHLSSRLENLEKFFNLYQFLIKKELNRSNHIEAIGFYNNFTLAPLLEVLRLKYNPLRYNFRTRYVYYDLPKDVVTKLHDFYFIKDSEDLKAKHKEAINWFNEVATELKNISFEEKLKIMV